MDYGVPVSVALAIAGAGFGLAFKRPRIFQRVEAFTTNLAFAILTFSAGALLGGYMTRNAVTDLTKDMYGFSAPITESEESTDDNTDYILGTITRQASHALDGVGWTMFWAGFVLVVGGAGRKLADMELEELSGRRAKEERGGDEE